MLPEELILIVNDIKDKKCELQNIEIKKAFQGTPLKLYDTLSSFSNQRGGGTIVFGIEETNKFQVCGVYNPQDLQKKVTEQANQMDPIVRPLFTVAIIGDKTIVSAEIAECDIFEKPCYYKGAGKIRGSYIRVGEADMPMTEYEIYSYEVFKRKIHDELRTVPEGIASGIDKNEMIIFLAKLKGMKPNLANLPEEEILVLSGIKADGRLTVAGLMLFGRFPQGLFPQLCITAVVVPGTEMGEIGDEDVRFIDNKKFEGTIPQMLEGSLSFVQRNMKIKTIINEQGIRADKEEYPVKAIREILINALVHRDYSVNTESSPIRVLMFSNRIVVENPGGLYGILTIDSLGKVGADTRNPYLASALEIMIHTENRFSGIPFPGIPTIRFEMDKAELRAPVFESKRGVFRATLYNDKKGTIQYDDMDLEQNILSFCREPKSREDLASLLKVNSVSYMMNKYIQPLMNSGKIKMTLPETPKSKNQRYVKR